jgi:hypothetical protein
MTMCRQWDFEASTESLKEQHGGKEPGMDTRRGCVAY